MADGTLGSRWFTASKPLVRVLPLTTFSVLFGASIAICQGPSPTYFHDLATRVPWAECLAYQPGGSSQQIPFFPAIVMEPVRAPAGTHGYSRDVLFDSDLIFVGQGLGVSSGQSEDDLLLDVEGAVVLMTHDTTTSDTLEERVMIAARNGSAAVAVFPREDSVFYPVLKPQRMKGFDDLIPVISLSHETARRLFAAHSPLGEQALLQWQEGEEAPRRERMILKLKCSFTGRFRRVESPRFVLLTRDQALTEDDVDKLLRVNERSVDFLLDLFDGADLAWTKVPTVYFTGYDSKVFYTLHWGEALATATGSYLVYSGTPDFGLVVHENAHTLFDRSWGETTSFLTEGLAMYAQARASDPTLNHRRTLELRRRGVSVPLGRLLDHEIGTPGEATDFGYPASGSFVEFLLDREGLPTFEKLYKGIRASDSKEDALHLWLDLYGASPSELEVTWISWLVARFEAKNDD